MKNKNAITFIDLFAGIGGFHIAFSNLGAKCVYVSEWDKYCRITYEEYFKPKHPDLFRYNNKFFGGDIKEVTKKTKEEIRSIIPEFNILTGGFPCQPFSQAGKKKGFLDEARGTLFYDIVKILDARKPKAYFIENVRGLLNHDNRNTIKEMEKIIRKLKYSFHVYSVKASDYGLPTHRPRLYMIGFRNDPQDKVRFKAPEKIPLRFNLSQLFRKKIDKDIGYTLRLGGASSGVHDRRNWDRYLMANGKEHAITVKEATRMMGFPKDFTFPKEISDRQKMRQLGNSVAIDAIQAYAVKLLEVLDQVK